MAHSIWLCCIAQHRDFLRQDSYTGNSAAQPVMAQSTCLYVGKTYPSLTCGGANSVFDWPGV